MTAVDPLAGIAVLDHDRAERTGVPEVVLGEWKSATQIAALLDGLSSRGSGALATRIAPDKASDVLAALPVATYHEMARVVRIAPKVPRHDGGLIGVVAAGTSDLPVVEEAAVCAEFFGARVQRITDVGVAGLHRLVARLDDLRRCDVLIVVAGMEGALPSVIAGLVDVPLIAVPTSVGYGISAGGLIAMATMLSSCAPGITVVNIDNGFGAAVAAVRISRLADALREARR